MSSAPPLLLVRIAVRLRAGRRGGRSPEAATRQRCSSYTFVMEVQVSCRLGLALMQAGARMHIHLQPLV